MTKNIRPLGNKLLVGAYFVPEQRRGTIVIPDANRWQHELDRVFWVIAVGPGCKHVKVGDRVICAFGHSSVTPIVDDPQKRGFITEDQVIGFLEG
jgi:co-chaperonin GroES (HSP10)